MKEALRQLEAWLSEEGIATGARFVNHIEYDCNWRGAFRVILREWRDKKLFEWMREGTNNTGRSRGSRLMRRQSGARNTWRVCAS